MKVEKTQPNFGQQGLNWSPELELSTNPHLSLFPGCDDNVTSQLTLLSPGFPNYDEMHPQAVQEQNKPPILM